VKARYSAKPKLKVWTPKIKDLLENMRSNYKQWVSYGKPTNPTNIIYSQKILSRKVFRKAIRIEEAKQRELIKYGVYYLQQYGYHLFSSIVDMFNGDVVYICRLPWVAGFDTFFQFG
jgi:hypothetical protein